MKKIKYFVLLIVFVTTACDFLGNSFTDDRDGRTYKTIKIGNQIWMAENLNYNIGEGSSCFDESDKYCNVYGRLYTSTEAKYACPNGWRLPRVKDWEILLQYLGENAGGKLKATGTSLWKSPNNGATNESGFNALPGGYYEKNFRIISLKGNPYQEMGSVAIWWAFDDDKNKYIIYELDYYSSKVSKGYKLNTSGRASIRCIKN